MIEFILLGIIAIIFLFLSSGIRIIRPTERALVETLGKYSRMMSSGINYAIPILQHTIRINITERMTDIEPQEIITSDNLNAKVDCVIFFRIKGDEQSVKNAVYQVQNVDSQLETLARTTARNVIGTMPFREVNSERNELNKRLQTILAKETGNWGVEVLKVELKDITPPEDVQDTMNKVIKAENEKQAAVDLATARETEADGRRRANIKEAEGLKQGKILVAEGQAQAIKLVNESANKYFVGNAQRLKQMEVTQASLENNSKIILSKDGINPQLLIGDLPIKEKKS